MEKQKKQNKRPGKGRLKNIQSQLQRQEDAVLKVGMQFFADELLHFFQIEGEVDKIALTEQVHLELLKKYEDFNIVMKTGGWKHFEFQSTNEGKAGLKRFRTYEAIASQQYDVEITTYVLYSGQIQNPVTELTEGINTYRIVPIIMTDWKIEDYLAGLVQKQQEGRLLEKKDLVPLTICTLMGGEMPMRERIKEAFRYTHEAKYIMGYEQRKIEAMIYTMATKFLEQSDMKEIEEAIKMTGLVAKLVGEGIEEGVEKGKSTIITNMLNRGMSVQDIVYFAGVSEEEIEKVKKEIESGR